MLLKHILYEPHGCLVRVVGILPAFKYAGIA